MITIRWKAKTSLTVMAETYNEIKRRGYRVNFVNADEWRVLKP